ncbi:MAG: rod shape-determining protein RodA [Deltaproteobacteria bacterium]|nr:rod shape-determining protein RodA [Deltaproteobacteria bacterium]MBW1951714.1 rod shape-determining protein RodA [Deltaproteobacteria bacterium]MBW1987264.1 rod shape-determining protein RodA [Deltaproteobacteria bacterium]MBW2134727.1 rod shape-determining protein RodA [Deltaproteobacteria bacterium]
MIDRRLIHNFDWFLLGLVLVIVSLGILNLYSAGLSQAARQDTPLYIKQLYWLGFGFGLMLMTLLFDYRNLEKVAYPLFWLTVVLLVLVLVFGKVVSGSQRWLPLGPLSFQPSELTKLAIILALARHFSPREQLDPLNLRELLVPFILALIPFALVVKQPDLGTAFLIALIAATMVLFVGVRWQILMALGASLLLLSPLLWHFLKDYQKQRILTFLNPDDDPLGAGYHIIQSKIAVGSGLLWGKGFLQGTQSKLNFLPEQHTDFVFSVFAEEWGFAGSFFLLLLYILLILWGLQISRACKERFGNLLALGLIAMIFWQIFINISMVTGMLPVVGITLPLFSYGGSSLISTLISIGLLLNIRMRLLPSG